MEAEIRKVPESVALVALGNSKQDYIMDVSKAGSRQGVADETWVINKLADIIKHDVLFRMDDLMDPRKVNLKVIQDRDNIPIHDRFDKVLRAHPGPIMTSKKYDEYPGSLEYPLEKVINYLGYSYFATTPAYAVAFAAMIGVKHMYLYGCDYNYYYNKSVAEQGRGNMEFVMAICMAKGLRVSIAPSSSLLNTNVPLDQQFYGYSNLLEVKQDEVGNGSYQVVYRPDLEELTTATMECEEAEAYKKLVDKYGVLTAEQIVALVEAKKDRQKEAEEKTDRQAVLGLDGNQYRKLQ